MEAFDCRKAAEEVVEMFHIHDLEWRDALIEQYAEALEQQRLLANRRLILLKNEPQQVLDI